MLLKRKRPFLLKSLLRNHYSVEILSVFSLFITIKRTFTSTFNHFLITNNQISVNFKPINKPQSRL